MNWNRGKYISNKQTAIIISGTKNKIYIIMATINNCPYSAPLWEAASHLGTSYKTQQLPLNKFKYKEFLSGLDSNCCTMNSFLDQRGSENWPTSSVT